jgi:YHS domain-containing protein
MNAVRNSIISALTIASAVVSLGGNSAFAVEEINVVPGLTAVGKPLGLHGRDAVALIRGEGSRKGSATYTAVHDGVAYYFVNQTNRDTFKANPTAFAVQNGGYCTFGVSVAKKFDGDPDYAAVVDGKLYVFLNEDIYKEFLKDKAGTIVNAAANWPKIKHTAAAKL